MPNPRDGSRDTNRRRGDPRWVHVDDRRRGARDARAFERVRVATRDARRFARAARIRFIFQPLARYPVFAWGDPVFAGRRFRLEVRRRSRGYPRGGRERLRGAVRGAQGEERGALGRRHRRRIRRVCTRRIRRGDDSVRLRRSHRRVRRPPGVRGGRRRARRVQRARALRDARARRRRRRAHVRLRRRRRQPPLATPRRASRVRRGARLVRRAHPLDQGDVSVGWIRGGRDGGASHVGGCGGIDPIA